MSVPYATARWPAATSTAVLWALAAGSIVFWGLRLSAPADSLAPPAVPAAAAAPDPVAVARSLGVIQLETRVAATPDAASRFALLGVVVDSDQRGAALIAVDGRPPRPFRVGAQLADGYVLQSLDRRAIGIGARVDAPPAFTIELPLRPQAANLPPSPVTYSNDPGPVVAPVNSPSPAANATANAAANATANAQSSPPGFVQHRPPRSPPQPKNSR
jgi:general secretion pathway protein C